MFCPTYHVRLGGRCVPVMNKIYTNTIGLLLKSTILKGTIPGPDFIARKHSDDPEKMLRSKCLDFQWSSIFIWAEYNNGENKTRSIRLTMVKLFKKQYGFQLPTMLKKIATCVSTPWEILLNDQWFTVSFDFPTVQGQTATGTSQTIISRTKSLLVKEMYVFSKPDLCHQVWYALLICQ